MSNLLKVRKGNRSLLIDPNIKAQYLKEGYDVINPKTGKVIERATGGRSVSLPEHYKIVDELNKLKAQGGTAELEKEIAELKKENAVLKGKITKLESGK